VPYSLNGSLAKSRRCTTCIINGPKAGAFQQYACLPARPITPIPHAVSYEQACVLPLGVATSASSLFGEETLALSLPKVGHPRNGQVVLIWGAGTSVGICGVQLARGAGYEVFATASQANKDLVDSVGAKYFDYNSDTLVDDIQAALNSRKLAAIFCSVNNEQATTTCVKLAKLSGLNFACGIMPLEPLDGVGWRCPNLMSFSQNEVGPAVFHDYLPKALETREFVALPKAEVVGHGPEAVQNGLDQVMAGYMKSGGGARKLIVTF
jgi:NADPH:quinone reductase-like Zn-dependent oxidoreductase